MKKSYINIHTDLVYLTCNKDILEKVFSNIQIIDINDEIQEMLNNNSIESYYNLNDQNIEEILIFGDEGQFMEFCEKYSKLTVFL